MDSLTYDGAVAALYSYTYRGLDPARLHLPDAARPLRSAALLARFGSPQLTYPTVHITGTKGKGSVSAMTAAILKSAGLRVGLLTSPHLQDLRERIQIDGQMIPKEAFTGLMAASLPIFDAATDARFPECLAAIAFQYFAHEHADIVVVEVGLGGRLDSTNVLNPTVCAFTSISYDHMHLLGNTLEEIAREKAGIIKPGCAVVSAPQTPGVIDVLAAAAAAQNCPVTIVGRDLPFTPDQPARDGQGLTIARDSGPIHFKTALLGAHQAVNAATAIAISDRLHDRGFPITDGVIADGLARVAWPGRLEIVRAAAPLIVLDGAHNGDSGLRLRTALETLFANRPRVLVYGSKANKDVIGMLREIVPIADHLILTRSADLITQDPAQLIDYVRTAGYAGALTIAENVASALEQATRIAGNNGLVCLTGSLYIVGEARNVLGLAPNELGNVM